MTVSMKRAMVALRPPTSIPALLSVTDAILSAMTGNTWFPTPTPPLATVAAALAELRTAEVAALSRTRELVTFRNEKARALRSLLTRLKAYVQGVADDHPQQAASIIESAHMSFWTAGPPPKLGFVVKPGKKAGTVVVAVRAVAKDASYEWAWSDDDGKTWHVGPRVLQSRTTLRGLPSDTVCLFMYRTTTRKGEGDWSAPLACRVP